ncbi:sulfatase-like hydrolase/transferase [Panacagrimonas sp.]|uniref:sulfatase-like hydrolase/transferase n=1 Tax=Panacagrimonas sp. TaxID=2480088 RepID=UPI003B5274C4
MGATFVLRTFLFLIICLAVLATCLFMATVGYEIQLGNRKAAGFLLTTLLGSPLILASVAAQLVAMVGLYALWLTALWRISGLAGAGGHWSQHPAACLAWLWLASTWILLRAHAAWFPNSSWTWATEPLFDRAAVWGVDLLCAIALGYLLFRAAPTLIRRLRDRGRHDGFRMRRIALSPWSYLIFLFCASAVVNALAPGPASTGKLRAPAAVTANTNRDVVILGLDSLRREVVEDPASWGMPNLAALVANGHLNDNVVTPLARTFPSWVTILTGMHPTQSGARTNHAPQERVARNASMAWTFRDAGYRTVYATDETRFSHILPAFGFDEVIGPQIGVTDFLLGQFSDQPLINFFVQMPGAEHFLPALVGNRAFAHAYVPERFNRRFVAALGSKGDRPLFLSVHLCTAHWPFFAAEAGSAVQEPGGGPLDVAKYQHMLRLVDRQLGDMLDQLGDEGYLTQETLLVVLSDHGEGLPSDSAAPLTVRTHGVDVDLSWPMGGHGGSLLAPEQWQSFVLFSVPVARVPFR